MNTTQDKATIPILKAGPVFNKTGRALFWTDESKPGKWQRRLDEAGIFSEKHAALIVRAVNQFEALTAVAEAAKKVYNDPHTLCSCAEILKQALAALDALRKETV